MRKRAAGKADDGMDVDYDLSSDEDESEDATEADDVDSDDLDEPPEQILGASTNQFTEQDFIGIT